MKALAHAGGFCPASLYHDLGSKESTQSWMLDQDCMVGGRRQAMDDVKRGVSRGHRAPGEASKRTRTPRVGHGTVSESVMF